MLGKKHSEETKLKIAATKLGKCRSDETKEKLRVANLGKRYGGSTKKKLSLVHKGKPKSIETRLKMSAHQFGKNNVMWKGGVSFEPYCQKFNREFKERVRAFFMYTCVECGAVQTNKKHCVHHVNFNKMSCCDGTEPLFVTLCGTCHNHTNKNREYWEKRFTKMINDGFDGKCYLTREEFSALDTL
jgi:hypothetical protein